VKNSQMLLVCVVVTIACNSDNPAGPSGAKETVSITVCSGASSIWVAAKNETEGWRAISPDASGAFTFDATPSVSIAIALTDSRFTSVRNVTREELARLSHGTCEAFSGTRDLHGDVAGLNDAQQSWITMGLQTVAVSGNAYSLSALPERPLDLVATRFVPSRSQSADRVIVRRSVDLPSGSTMPLLDFNSAESAAPELATLAVGNLGGDVADIHTTFWSAGGGPHPLTVVAGSNGTQVAYASVPAAMRLADDVHSFSALAVTGPAGLDRRSLRFWYRSPINRTVTLGPMLSVPTVSTVASPSNVRMQARLASQSEYPTAAAAEFYQDRGGTVYVLTTAGYLGGRPPTWELTVPDFPGTGYSSAWGLQVGEPTHVFVHGFGVTAGALLRSGPGADGDEVRGASRYIAPVASR
jgi:hypothetical protein